MNCKGYCLWASDVPNPEAPHFIVIISSENEDRKVLVVAISSIKFKSDGTTKYYDKACVLSPEDITDEKGKQILSVPSYVRYEYAMEIASEDIMDKQLNRLYRYKCKVSEELLLKIQEGAKISLELEDRFKKYFSLF